MRPDIAVAINFLCTRTNKYTLEDQFKLNRVLKYLHGTRDIALTFQKSNNFEVNIMCDASHGVHHDGKGQGGALVLINANPVFFRSRKLKINSLSSTESELICVSDSLSPIINIMNIIDELGFEITRKTLYQDNVSTIRMIENGRSTSMKTKHINLRYFTIRERISEFGIRIKHLPTAEMLADMLTKPLQGSLFSKMRGKLFNIR
jgi:histone deacetylase 1/2